MEKQEVGIQFETINQMARCGRRIMDLEEVIKNLDYYQPFAFKLQRNPWKWIKNQWRKLFHPQYAINTDFTKSKLIDLDKVYLKRVLEEELKAQYEDYWALEGVANQEYMNSL